MTADKLWRSLVVVRTVTPTPPGTCWVEVPAWKPGQLHYLDAEERTMIEQAIGQPLTDDLYLFARVNLGARTAAALRFAGWELAPEPLPDEVPGAE